MSEKFKLDNSGRRLVVDPVSRIEGHLRVEVNLDKNNVIRNAVSTGTMWRGLEVILKGRDPRDAWAFTERICGVCTGTHALTSVRAVEDALSIQIPENAHLIRNIMQLNLITHDHLVHFYHLHALDWVDVISALKADPKKTSELAQGISSWPLSSPGYFRDVQGRLQKFMDSGQLGIFSNAYWGNPAYKLPPEANLLAFTHYLEALDFQKEIVKVHAVFGGKNPHPNWLVGGVPCPINLQGTGAVGALNMERLNLVKSIIDQCATFVEQVYIPDLLAIASFYKDWLYGGGIAGEALLSYGDIPDRANDHSPENLLLPRGAIIGGNLGEIHPVNLADPEQIQEFVTHSWYKYPDESRGLHPFDGVTDPDFSLGPNTKGSKTRIEALDEAGKYSWIKAPRWRGNAMEVGPLARMVMAYQQPARYPFIKETIDNVLKKLNLPVTALFSTLGRTAARGIETLYCARLQQQMFDRLLRNLKAGDTNTADISKWNPGAWPAEAQGVGFTEAPRGALGHWIKIKNGKIDAYQCVVPTTWNGSPRCPNGQIGAFEASLLDTPLAKADEPLEILRTLHSFDPCLACASHVISPDGQEMATVKVR
ncbi:MAG: nickel-dependent hydrogenase large subunit [Betaproteobacteria bacterium]|nr:nickel-dependent hydrogenase large subunit [Betaproteobacteria bacterium]